MKQLLVISCSKNKVTKSASKAIELYNGPYYQIIRKLIREGNYPHTLDVAILSAKYGLISSENEIEYYDQIMTKERAVEINATVLNEIEKVLTTGNYNTIYVNLGKNYIKAIEGYDKLIPSNVNVIVGEGEIGMRMSSMKKWIESLNETSVLR